MAGGAAGPCGSSENRLVDLYVCLCYSFAKQTVLEREVLQRRVKKGGIPL